MFKIVLIFALPTSLLSLPVLLNYWINVALAPWAQNFVFISNLRIQQCWESQKSLTLLTCCDTFLACSISMAFSSTWQMVLATPPAMRYLTWNNAQIQWFYSKTGWFFFKKKQNNDIFTLHINTQKCSCFPPHWAGPALSWSSGSLGYQLWKHKAFLFLF